MKSILYIGNFSFPDGNASGKRVYTNGKVFKQLGYDVIYVGVDKNIKKDTSIIDTRKIFDGFEYYNLPRFQNPLNCIGTQSPFIKVKKIIQQKLDTANLKVIIYYGSPSTSLFIKKLINYAKKNKVIILSDCVDWLTPQTNNLMFNLIKKIDTNYQKTVLNTKVNGLIVISNYLDAYYQKKKIPTVIIPPLNLGLSIRQSKIQTTKKIKLIYAGIPFRLNRIVRNADSLKDRIDKAIIALCEVKKSNIDFIFNVYGFTKEQYMFSLPNQKQYIDILGDSICFHGYNSNDIVTQKILESDFTILIRDISRDTTAGFPTKISESIGLGIPVITTHTSDLDNYLIEGSTGFFLDNSNQNSLNSSLVNILRFQKKDILKFKELCLDENPFYYEKHTEKIKYFFENIHVI